MLPVNRVLVKIRASTNIVLRTETLIMTPMIRGARLSSMYSGVICGGSSSEDIFAGFDSLEA